MLHSRLRTCPGAGKILDEFVENYICPYCDRSIKVKLAGKNKTVWIVSSHNPKPHKQQRNPFARPQNFKHT